jgi:hypothetical protein
MPNQTSVQWVLGTPTPGVMQPQQEDDQSSMIKVKNEWNYTFAHPYAFMK